jgi:hypothetical protein
MGRVLLVGLLAVGLLSLRGPQVRGAEQEAINRAVERGVAALKQLQREDGTWPHNEIGATALAGLALLECGVGADDPALRKATRAIRQASPGLKHTYSVALAIIYFDRLGDPADVPFIESLTVRLLAGQSSNGGWTYNCPDVNPAEVNRLTEHLRQVNELVGRKDLPKEGAKEDAKEEKPKRTVKDLPQEVQAQLLVIARAAKGETPIMADNSNTQFATLALWVARKHGLPVDGALAGVDTRFRVSQNADGGWSYTFARRGPRPGAERSTATMTCAGLLGLSVAHGVLAEQAKEKGKDVDLKKDQALIAGLAALGTAIDHPVAKKGGLGQVPQASGKGFYFLWSLERVAVSLDLDTIAKKDWYGWGSEILIASQQPTGLWNGEYGTSGADTAFALLFLRRSNLARDLTANLKGKLQDQTLRAGGVGGEGLKPEGEGLKPAIGGPDKPETDPASPGKTEPKETRPAPLPDTESGRLGKELVEASGPKQDQVLDKLRDSKGVVYTEALATAIPRMGGDGKRKAREALAERLARMTAKSLTNYLKDDDAEIRRAAALACAMKESKEHIPQLIELLRDPENTVVRATVAALKDLTGQNFGPGPDATRAERDEAIAAWQAWWKKQGQK